MANKQIKYNIGFNVDKAGINEVRQELMSLEKDFGLTDIQLINKQEISKAKADLQDVQNAAKVAGKALETAYNPKVNAINIQAFNQELAKSGMNIQTLSSHLAKAGLQGQQAFRDMAVQVMNTGFQLKQTNGWLSKMGETLGNTIKWSIASSAINTVTGAIRNAWGYTKALDASLNDIRIVTGKSAEEMDKFASKANKAAKALGTATNAYAKASLIYYQQGLSDKEVQTRTDITIKAANVTGQSAAEVSEQLTAVWNGYKVVAEEAESYIDKLSAVAATTASDLEELSEGMSKVASGANAMGVDIDQLTAQLSTIISVTRQDASSVGTALKTIFARMGDLKVDGVDEFGVSLGEVSGTLKQVGIDVLDQQGNLRDMGTVMEEVAGKWGTWTEAQQQAVAVAMAGKRQYNNLLALFENWDMYESALSTSQASAGTLQKQQDIYMDSLEGHLQQLSTAGEKVYKAFFDSESMKDLLDMITAVVDQFGMFTKSIGGGGNLLLGLGGIAARVFSDNIGRGITNFIVNLQNARYNASQLQAELATGALLGNNLIEKESDGYRKVVGMMQDRLKYQKQLNAEQRASTNEMIEQTNSLEKQKEEQKSQVENYKKLYNKLGGDKEGEYSVVGIGADHLTEDKNAENLHQDQTKTQNIDKEKQEAYKAEQAHNKQVQDDLQKQVELVKKLREQKENQEKTVKDTQDALDKKKEEMSPEDLKELKNKKKDIQKAQKAFSKSEEKLQQTDEKVEQQEGIVKQDKEKISADFKNMNALRKEKGEKTRELWSEEKIEEVDSELKAQQEELGKDNKKKASDSNKLKDLQNQQKDQTAEVMALGREAEEKKSELKDSEKFQEVVKLEETDQANKEQLKNTQELLKAEEEKLKLLQAQKEESKEKLKIAEKEAKESSEAAEKANDAYKQYAESHRLITDFDIAEKFDEAAQQTESMIQNIESISGDKGLYTEEQYQKDQNLESEINQRQEAVVENETKQAELNQEYQNLEGVENADDPAIHEQRKAILEEINRLEEENKQIKQELLPLEQEYNGIVEKQQEVIFALDDAAEGRVDTMLNENQTELDLLRTEEEYAEVLDKVRNKEQLNTKEQKTLQNYLGKANKILKKNKKEWEAHSDGLKKTAKQAKDTANKSAQLGKNWKDAMKQLNTQKLVSGFSSLIGSVTQFASGIMAIKNIGNIISDDSLSGGEKFQQILGVLMTSIPMVISGFKGMISSLRAIGSSFGLVNIATSAHVLLSKKASDEDKRAAFAKMAKILGIKLEEQQLKELTVEQMKQLASQKLLEFSDKSGLIGKLIKIVALKMEKKAQQGNTSATIAQTMANYGLQASCVVLLIVILAIVAAILILVAIISALTKAFESISDNGQKAFEKASEAAKSATERFNEVKEAYEDLKESLKDYNDAQKAIDEMTKGTEEWKEAIAEANMQVIDLIDKYPELAQYVSDVNGQLKISEEGQEAVLEQQKGLVEQASRGKMAANIAKAQAENNMIRQQGANRALQTDKYASAAIWGGILAAGLSPWAGAATATGLALESQRREDAYDSALNVISERGNSILGSYEAFADALKEEGVNDDLIDALWENKEELAKNSAEIAANNAAIKMQQQQIANSFLEQNSEAYQNSDNKTQLSKIIGAQATDESAAYKEIMKQYGANDGNVDKDQGKKLAEDYFKQNNITATGLSYDKDSGMVTYTDENGDEKKISAMMMAQSLAQEKALKAAGSEANVKNIQNSLNIATEAFQNAFGGNAAQSLLGLVAGEKSADLSGMTSAQINNLDQFTGLDLREMMAMGGDNVAKGLGFKDIKELAATAKTLGYSSVDAYLQAMQTSIDNYNYEVSRLVVGLDNSVKEAFADLQEQDFAKDWSLSLQKTVSKSLQNAFEKGGPAASSALKELFMNAAESLSTEDMSALAGVVEDIDWSSSGAIVEFNKRLRELGITVDSELLTPFIQQMQGVINVVKETLNNITGLQAKLKEFNDIAKELEIGSTITKEDFDNLVKYNTALEDYFILTADGYKYLGGADKEISKAKSGILDYTKVNEQYRAAETVGSAMLEDGENAVFQRGKTTDASKGAQLTNLLKHNELGEYDGILAANGINAEVLNDALTKGTQKSTIADGAVGNLTLDKLKGMKAADLAKEISNSELKASGYETKEKFAQAIIDDATKQVNDAKTYINNAYSGIAGTLDSIEDGTFDKSRKQALTTAISAQASNYDELQDYKHYLDEESYNKLAGVYLAEEAEELGVNSKAWAAIAESIPVDEQAAYLDNLKKIQGYDEIDYYKNLTDQIDQYNNKLDNLSNIQDKLSGRDLIKNLEEQASLQKELVALEDEKFKKQQDEWALRRQSFNELNDSALEKFGISGITYDESGKVDENTREKILSAYENATGEEKEYLKSLLDDIDSFNDSVTEGIEDHANAVSEAYQRQADLLIEAFNTDIQLHLDLEDAKREWENFKAEMYNGKEGNKFFDEESAADAVANSLRNTESLNKSMDTVFGAMTNANSTLSQAGGLANAKNGALASANAKIDAAKTGYKAAEDAADAIGKDLEKQLKDQAAREEKVKQEQIDVDMAKEAEDIAKANKIKNEKAFKDAEDAFNKKSAVAQQKLTEKQTADKALTDATKKVKSTQSARDKAQAAVNAFSDTTTESGKRYKAAYDNLAALDAKKDAEKNAALKEADAKIKLAQKTADSYSDPNSANGKRLAAAQAKLKAAEEKKAKAERTDDKEDDKAAKAQYQEAQQELKNIEKEREVANKSLQNAKNNKANIEKSEPTKREEKAYQAEREKALQEIADVEAEKKVAQQALTNAEKEVNKAVAAQQQAQTNANNANKAYQAASAEKQTAEENKNKAQQNLNQSIEQLSEAEKNRQKQEQELKDAQKAANSKENKDAIKQAEADRNAANQMMEKYRQDLAAAEAERNNAVNDIMNESNRYLTVVNGQLVVNSAQYEEDMQNWLESSQDYYEQLQEEATNLYQAYLTAQEEIMAAYDTLVEKLSSMNGILSSQVELVKLVGKNAQGSGAQIADLYQSMLMNSAANFNIAKQQLATAQSEYDKIMALGDQASKEQIATVTANLQASTENVLSMAQEYSTMLAEAYGASLTGIIDDYLKEINGLDLAGLTQNWELESAKDERFIDSVNASYEISSLERQFKKSIDETDNYSAQKKLNAVMQDQLKILREKDKLSQYDLDRANAMYELTLKQIALEEAQKTASKMKLARDASGNYSYQYVADQDAVADAQEQLDKAQNDLYNLDKERNKELIDEYYATLSEAQAQMSEAVAEGDEQRLAHLQEYYFGEDGLLSNVQEELGLAETNLNNIGAILGGNDWTSPFEDFATAITNSDLGSLINNIETLTDTTSVNLQLAANSINDLLTNPDSVLTKAVNSLDASIDEGIVSLEETVASSVGAASTVLTKLPNLLTNLDTLGKRLQSFGDNYYNYLENQLTKEEQSVAATEENTEATKALTQALLKQLDSADNVTGNLTGWTLTDGVYTQNAETD